MTTTFDSAMSELRAMTERAVQAEARVQLLTILVNLLRSGFAQARSKGNKDAAVAIALIDAALAEVRRG